MKLEAWVVGCTTGSREDVPGETRPVIRNNNDDDTHFQTIGVLGFDSRGVPGIVLFTTVCRTTLGLTQLSIQWVPGALSLGVKRPRREADHSHLMPRPRMRRAIPPLLQYVFMAWCLVKHRDNFTFTLTFTHFHTFSSPNFIICLAVSFPVTYNLTLSKDSSCNCSVCK
jgi:hypothetical protein